MSKTHWLQSPNKNYLGHWDLPESGELMLTIKSANWEAVTNPITHKTEEKRVVRFKEKGVKPFICNQTNAQSIQRSTGINYMEDSKGSVICLFLGTTKVMGEQVDCIRIKKDAKITVEQLQVLFMEKEHLIDPAQVEPIDQAIRDKNEPSFLKIFKYLSTL